MRSFGKTTTRMLALLACALTMTACAPAEPQATPTPTKTAIFASEDEALAAAVTVYKKYSEAYFAVLASGVADYQRVRDFVTRGYFTELNGDTSFENKGEHTEGAPEFDSAALIDLHQSQESATIQIRICQDVSNVNIYNSNDELLSTDSRQLRFPIELSLRWDNKDNVLRIADEGPWQGENFCSQ